MNDSRGVHRVIAKHLLRGSPLSGNELTATSVTPTSDPCIDEALRNYLNVRRRGKEILSLF
jgi:hypothetical protein